MRRRSRAEARRQRTRTVVVGTMPPAAVRQRTPERFTSMEMHTDSPLGEDRAVRDFARSPYDPTYAIGMAPYLTRGTMKAAAASGRQRIGALVVMVLMAVSAVIGLALTFRSATVRDGAWVANALWSGLFTFVFGAFALALARRLWSARHAA